MVFKGVESIVVFLKGEKVEKNIDIGIMFVIKVNLEVEFKK